MQSIQKRTFSNLRNELIVSLSRGNKTINQLSNETRINWKTVNNHLIHLVGRGLAKEVLTTPYARIFEITKHGKESLFLDDDSDNADSNLSYDKEAIKEEANIDVYAKAMLKLDDSIVINTTDVKENTVKDRAKYIPASVLPSDRWC